MKPVSLEFCGLNSFSEPAKVDFGHLLEFGLFGIFGDTGSGKSTILDAIVFALYGTVSRAKSLLDAINFHREEASVAFEFEIVYDGKRRLFRAERTVKKRTSNNHTATLYEGQEGKLVAVASGAREVTARVTEIIGLEQKDFEKCIALPQGEFSQFVKAQRADRLKLIARLFDLEKYGEQLSASCKAHYAAAQTELGLAEERLKPYEGVTDGLLKGYRDEAAALESEEREKKAVIEELKKAEREGAALLEKKREGERLRGRLEIMDRVKAETDELERDLSRLERASAVAAAVAEGTRLRKLAEDAARELLEAERELEGAKAALEELTPEEEAGLERRVEELTELEKRALTVSELLKRMKRAEAELAAIPAEEPSSADPDYDRMRRETEEELAGLGEGNFVTFTLTQAKTAVMRGEYAVFADELDGLTEKYPEIEGDSRPISQKYRVLSEGEKTDVSDLKRAYDEREERRRELSGKLISIEKERGEAALREQREMRKREERARLEREVAELKGAIGEPTPPLEEVTASLRRAKGEQKAFSERKERANAELAKCTSRTAVLKEKSKNAQNNLEEARARYLETLRAGGFSEPAEADALIKKYGDAAEARESVQSYRQEYAAITRRLAELPDPETISEEAYRETREKLAAEEESAVARNSRLAVLGERIKSCELLLKEKKELTGKREEARREFDRYAALRDLLSGSKFMEFVAEEYLETVAVNAGSRLLSLTGGRYFLRHRGAFYVGDNFNGGAERPVYTLSGGETFLVSLSLALALGAEICARSLRPIEFFFLDEGFGTLDEALVDVVMDSLEKLRGEHFSIGVISHVGELKNRIDRKLIVEKATEEHGSVIHTQ